MLKLILMLICLMVVASLLVALPRSALMRSSALEFVNAAAAQGKGENPSLNGQTPDSQRPSPTPSLTGLMKLLSGQSADASGAKATPSRPPTIIYPTNADASRDKAADTTAIVVPPGVRTMFVDGRVQIYYPAAKPRKGR